MVGGSLARNLDDEGEYDILGQYQGKLVDEKVVVACLDKILCRRTVQSG